MPRDASIATLRRHIDRLDDQILRLLNQRAALGLRIGAQKARTQRQVYDPVREKAILDRLLRANEGPLRSEHLRAIYREVLAAGRAVQQVPVVTYFGPEGTYTHLASQAHFGDAVTYQPAATIGEVFADVERGRADLGVVPVENSTEGMVALTLDLLLESPLRIHAEISLPIHHCLLGRPGLALAGVRRVVAHPQALAQCRRWLAAHLPGIECREAASNASAAAEAARTSRTAAIAAAATGARYQLDLLAENVQDFALNTTRFLVLAATDCATPSGDDKTSLLFSVRDEVGILFRMLEPFARHKIDLIKIESRPLRERPWEYYFFLDLKGHRREPRVRRALAEIEARALRLKVLGSYPAAPEVAR
jgi:chorismate mutase / prephenate dehydratase